MSKKFYFAACCLLLLVPVCHAQKLSGGKVLLAEMHKKYYKGICRSYTFSQKNKHYKNDTLIRESVWHEAVEFPDRFRIDFGEKALGNFVVFKNDSVFHYRKSALLKSGADSNNLLLLLGGMYYRDLKDVIARLEAAKYDLAKFSEQTWNGKPVFVIGASEHDLESNQVWVDAKTLVIVRILEKINEKDRMDMRFESHRPWCKGFVEDKVSFRRNGQLEQVEEYFNIKEAPADKNNWRVSSQP